MLQNNTDSTERSRSEYRKSKIGPELMGDAKNMAPACCSELLSKNSGVLFIEHCKLGLIYYVIHVWPQERLEQWPEFLPWLWSRYPILGNVSPCSLCFPTLPQMLKLKKKKKRLWIWRFRSTMWKKWRNFNCCEGRKVMFQIQLEPVFLQEMLSWWKWG